MVDEFPEYISVDYRDGEEDSSEDYSILAEKIEKAIEVTDIALDEYRNPAVMWTGGKDSTLVVYFVREVAKEHGYSMPPVVFIDHYQHFDEVTEFVEQWADRWNLDLLYARNEDVGRNAVAPGDDVRISELNEDNQREIREKLDYEDDTFPFLLDTYVGNHLLKTVALNQVIKEHDFDGIFSGVRWDEQEARANETFFSPRHDVEKYPPHDRIHPILQFEERSVWEVTWYYVVPDVVPGFPDDGFIPQDENDLPESVSIADLPVSPKYFEGFRSLGSEVSTIKSEDVPAWRQDLETTTERAGRAQDKEDLMERLRDLGYM